MRICSNINTRFATDRFAAISTAGILPIVVLWWLISFSAVAQEIPDPVSTSTEQEIEDHTTLPQDVDCIIEPNRVVDVGSAAIGVLTRIHVKRSERVKRGQLLAELDSGLESAQVEIARLRATLDTEIRAREVTQVLQQRNEQRANRLIRTQAMAEQLREEAIHDAAVAALRVQQAQDEQRLAQLELNRAEQALKRRQILSPFDGVIVTLLNSEGTRIDNQPIVTLAELHPLRVQAILPVEQFGDISTGMLAAIMPEHGKGTGYRAEVSAIDPVIDAASGTFGVELTLDNPDYRLPGGLRCKLDFLPAPASQELAEQTVPDPIAEDLAFDTHMRNEPATAEDISADPGLAYSPEYVTTLLAPSKQAPEHVESRKEEVTICQIAGPLRGKRIAEQLQASLQKTLSSVRIDAKRELLAHRFMVVIDIEASGQTARQVQKQLRRKGIRDSFALRDKAQVSLGIFSSRQRAETFRQRMVRLGESASIDVIFRESERFYLQIVRSSPDENLAMPSDVMAILAQQEATIEACPTSIAAYR